MLNNKPVRDCPFTRFTVPILFFAPMKIRELQPSEISEAANLLSRGMSDNPINVAAFGSDASRRQAALARFFRAGVL